MAREAGQIREEELDPQAEALRRAALAQIRQYGDPALRMQAREVEAVDDDLRRLLERMKRLMREANGIGLAATQVGVLRRALVFQPDREQEPLALVNPAVVERSEASEVDEEGCLSLPGALMPVERPVTVTLEGLDEDGAEVRLELDGLGARVAQHEIDHLDGILILDRTTPEARREALALLRPRVALA